MSQLLKGNNAPPGSKFFSIRVDPFSDVKQNNYDRVTSLDRVSPFPSKFQKSMDKVNNNTKIFILP